MPHRAIDTAGWTLWGVGTTATWVSQEKVTAIVLGLLGLIVLVGRTLRTEYQEWAKTRREQQAENIKLEIARAQQLASIRHDELLGKIDQLSSELETLRGERCLNAPDCPHRKVPSGDSIPVVKV